MLEREWEESAASLALRSTVRNAYRSILIKSVALVLHEMGFHDAPVLHEILGLCDSGVT